MTCLIWRRRNASCAESAGLTVILKLLLVATCWVSACSASAVGVGKLCRPALISCRLYLLVPRHLLFSSSARPRQWPGFGPVGDLPFATYACFPSALKLLEFGYQPVGISPMTL